MIPTSFSYTLLFHIASFNTSGIETLHFYNDFENSTEFVNNNWISVKTATKCSFVKECVRDLCKICVDGTDMNNCVEAIKALKLFSGIFLPPIERKKVIVTNCKSALIKHLLKFFVLRNLFTLFALRWRLPKWFRDLCYDVCCYPCT